MRELDRIAVARMELRKIESEEGWWQTAVHVAYLENTVKGALLGTRWKAKQPKEYYDSWFNIAQVNNERMDRIKRANQRHIDRLAREKQKKAL